MRIVLWDKKRFPCERPVLPSSNAKRYIDVHEVLLSKSIMPEGDTETLVMIVLHLFLVGSGGFD